MNLIFDRTQADVTYAAELNRKLGRGEALTAQELADWNAGLKGTYNATDMNRVDAAVRELGGLLTKAGYPVEYVDPHNLSPAIENEVELTANDFQQGKCSYLSGGLLDLENYICTNTMIPVVPDITITARVDIDILSDSGFVWYDADMAYIGGTNNGAPILWSNCFQAIPPANAAYCNININASAVTPADIGTVYVRQAAHPESARLPEEYTQVEYIESHGTEYIDTGFKANQDTRIVFDADVLEVTSTATGLFGCRDKIGSNGFYIFEITSSSGNYNDGYGNSYTTSIQLSASGKHKIDKNKNITYIDGTVGYTYSTQTFTTPATVTLFTVNQSSGVDERMSKLKLYSCVIYDNDIIVRYYIPCVNEFGTAGLYDTVSGAFFANSASQTGVFEHGNIITPSPEPEPSNEWKIGDIISSDTWSIYLKNVQNIREAYYTMPDTPELPMPTAPLTFDGANAIEKLLYDISKLYDAMVSSYRPCGSFKCGNNAQHLPLQRSVI